MFPSKISLFGTSLMLSVIGAAVVLSFRQFFFYIPFTSGMNFREFFAFIAQIGWVALLVVPPVLTRKTDRWKITKTWGLVSAVSIYPLATLAIKINNLALYGDPFALYLINFPALFLLEWAIPIFYVLCALELRKRSVREAATGRRSRYDTDAPLPFTRENLS